MKYLYALLALFIGAIISTTVFSQSGGGFEIDRSTVSDAGGGLSQGGDFELQGTIGQADAGNHAGTGFTLTGGFWVEAETDALFKDSYE